MRRLLAGLVLVAGAAEIPSPAWGACNLIPGTIKSYDGTLGALNRPFAASGERVEIGLRACDPGSSSWEAVASTLAVQSATQLKATSD